MTTSPADNAWTYVLLETDGPYENLNLDWIIIGCTHAAGVYESLRSAVGSMLGRIGVLPKDFDRWEAFVMGQLKHAAEHSDENEPIVNLADFDAEAWGQLDTPYDRVQFCPIDPTNIKR